MSFFEGLNFYSILIVMSFVSIYLGLKEKSRRWWINISSVLIVGAVFGQNLRKLACLLGFLALQMVIVAIFHKAVQKQLLVGEKKSSILVTACLTSLSSIVAVRLAELGLITNLGFLGISYMTFRALQYIIEVWDGLITKINYVDYLSFMLFFPALSAGPIDRSRRFDQDVAAIMPRKDYEDLLGRGLVFVLQGLLYKLVLSQYIYRYMISLKTVKTTVLTTISYMYSYGLYLFFDFAGYSLLAVGTAYIWGVRLPMNFDKPFISQNMVDFWNRWHISLSTWFRDFVFSRLMIRAMRKKWFKQKSTSAKLAYVTNMVLMGLWHGFTISYISYGIYHGLLLAASDWYLKKSEFHRKYSKFGVYKIASIFVTFQLVMFGFFIFSGRFFELLGKIIK